MNYYDNTLPVVPTPLFDAAYFQRATDFDVLVRDTDGNPVLNADGTPKTTKGELRDLLVPMAGDRARLLAQAANHQRTFVEQANDWVNDLRLATDEMEKHKPTGKGKSGPNVNAKEFDFDDFFISAATANTLAAARDSSNNSLLSTYFQLEGAGSPPYTGQVKVVKVGKDQAWSTFDNAMKSAIDQASQKAQLEQTSLQGLVSRQNNAIETMADLQEKFTSTHEKLVGNLRPAQ